MNEPRATDFALRVASRTHKPSDRTAFDPPNFCARDSSRNESYHASYAVVHQFEMVPRLRPKVLVAETGEKS